MLFSKGPRGTIAALGSGEIELLNAQLQRQQTIKCPNSSKGCGIGQALLEAKKHGGDPFAAIETILSWDAFAASITEAQMLAQPEHFDFLHRISEG